VKFVPKKGIFWLIPTVSDLKPPLELIKLLFSVYFLNSGSESIFLIFGKFSDFLERIITEELFSL